MEYRRTCAIVQPGHGEEEDGVGVAAASGVLAHTLVRLQRLSTRDEEDLELQTGVGGESWGKPQNRFFVSSRRRK